MHENEILNFIDDCLTAKSLEATKLKLQNKKKEIEQQLDEQLNHQYKGEYL